MLVDEYHAFGCIVYPIADGWRVKRSHYIADELGLWLC